MKQILSDQTSFKKMTETAKTNMEKTMTSLFDSTGLNKSVGSFMMIRTKMIVVGIISALALFTAMVVNSTISSKVNKARQGGGCHDTEDLDKAYKWGWSSSLVYGILMTICGGVTIALILSMFV
jgi:hypothetical protein